MGLTNNSVTEQNNNIWSVVQFIISLKCECVGEDFRAKVMVTVCLFKKKSYSEYSYLMNVADITRHRKVTCSQYIQCKMF